MGLSGLSILPGVPGVLRADFSGGAPRFWLTVASCSTGSLDMYPNPTSDGWACWAAIAGGSANGDLFSAESETGELTDVASANLATRGNFEEESEELEPVLVDLAVTEGVLFSGTACGAL